MIARIALFIASLLASVPAVAGAGDDHDEGGYGLVLALRPDGYVPVGIDG